MRGLITGGAGFIGSHLVRQLLQTDHQLVVMDNAITGGRHYLPAGGGFTCWQQDIRDATAKKKIQQEKFDVIIHLAAQTMVDASIKDPVFDASENIMGTLNVLEAARQCGARVIFASTAAAYGDVVENELPVLESHELSPQSFYGLTKVGVEKYLALYHQHYGLDYVICRFANVYGERQGDKGEGGVISIFAKRIAAGKDITIYGDGTQTRDFVYAGDIARGICKAMTTENVNTVYNLSTQTETSLLDLVRIMSEVSGCEITPKFWPVREGDIYRSMLSNQKAKAGLGWEPQVSLEDGLRRTMDYFRGI
ncbi:NAD-dependent epimerase/dehydratase family protein [Selenomonas ruminis]|uniref:NAD-dependent epimerase/dehydratase family protein n=1 Tax=Selenomonas ruminis TaxID=2593411 RepID=A0A5D6WBY8_9FIRM|nr:NAD-dependent epimerase/dehydratase family protein [Selenomonas sp. mPRGC5]TYZ24519.1 NAD-dependent epimerase/dehydratase family protein [Selenomonas sp. mPRGC5]